MLDCFCSAAKNLFKKRLRTILTAVGIAVGVASVVLIGGISQCGADVLDREMESLGLGGLAVSASTEAGTSLTLADLEVVKSCPRVEQAAPILLQSTDITMRDKQLSALIWGMDASAREIVSIDVLYGRMFSEQDLRSASNVCLVDEAFAKEAYSRSNIIGKKISFLCGGMREEFQIIGIVKTGSGLLQNMIGNYIPTFVYVPYTTMQTLNGRSDFDQIAVKVKQDSSVEQAGAMIETSLNRNSGIPDGYTASNLAKQRGQLTTILELVTLVFSAVGAVSLLVASLSIMTVMTVSVNERTREIGIKKAIGAKRSAIMLEFMFEALLISVFGCFSGLVFGGVISFAVKLFTGFFIFPHWNVILLCACFSLLSGLVFGMYPAYKASRLKPVEALRMD